MMFVLSMNRFNHLVHNIGGELRIFFPRSTSEGAGFRKGGGDLPGLGFPPPSRSGRTLKPRRTITVGSNKACNLETGVVDGRSTTSGAGTPPLGCRLLALTSRRGSDPSMAMCCIMAVLRPCIISVGIDSSLMSSFLAHVRASHGCSADPANDVTAGLLPKLWI